MVMETEVGHLSTSLDFSVKWVRNPTKKKMSCGAHAYFMYLAMLNASSTRFCVDLCIILSFCRISELLAHLRKT